MSTRTRRRAGLAWAWLFWGLSDMVSRLWDCTRQTGLCSPYASMRQDPPWTWHWSGGPVLLPLDRCDWIITSPVSGFNNLADWCTVSLGSPLTERCSWTASWREGGREMTTGNVDPLWHGVSWWSISVREMRWGLTFLSITFFKYVLSGILACVISEYTEKWNRRT